MKSLVHLTSDSIGDWDLARLLALVLQQHDELELEDVTFLVYKYGIWFVTENSTQKDDVEELIEGGLESKLLLHVSTRATYRVMWYPGVELVPSGVVE